MEARAVHGGHDMSLREWVLIFCALARMDRRFARHLKEASIGTLIHYPVLPHLFVAYGGLSRE